MPFQGESSGVIFKAILDSTPPVAIRFNPVLPPKLEDIINKALEKDRNLRYQGASEMRADLQRLKRDTDSGRSGVISAARTEAYTAVGTESISSAAVTIKPARPAWKPRVTVGGLGLAVLALLAYLASRPLPAVSIAGWSDPVPGRELHPLKSSAFHGALFRQLTTAAACFALSFRVRAVRNLRQR